MFLWGALRGRAVNPEVGKGVELEGNYCDYGITWSQTQLILIACQIRYHSHLWDHRSTGQL